MARKTGETLQSRQKGLQGVPGGSKKSLSWAAIGIDTSLTAISAVGVGFEYAKSKMVGPSYAEIRWLPEHDYFRRLKDAAKGHELILDVIHDLWVIELDRVVIAIEEPVPYGMIKRAQSAWVKQQCEIAGSFKGSLARWGFPHIYEINQSQWKKILRNDGVTIPKMPEGKWAIKQWAIQAFGLPDLPDLITRNGAKIPRPEGSKAKAVQPLDIYDAAGVCAWALEEVQSGRSVLDV